jgi:hypothetical protein
LPIGPGSFFISTYRSKTAGGINEKENAFFYLKKKTRGDEHWEEGAFLGMTPTLRGMPTKAGYASIWIDY